MKHADISDRIIGAAIKVHRGLGLGFQEYIYQRALEIELKNNGLKFTREYEMPVYYSGEKIGVRIEMGLLINFEGKSLQFKQQHNKNLPSSPHNPF